jgi:hypothetical protein
VCVRVCVCVFPYLVAPLVSLRPVCFYVYRVPSTSGFLWVCSVIFGSAPARGLCIAVCSQSLSFDTPWFLFILPHVQESIFFKYLGF